MVKSTKASFKKLSGDRRDFLKGAVAGTAMLLAPAEMARAAAAGDVAVDTDSNGSLGVGVQTMDRSGSDFMVDVIKSLGIEYVCVNPGSTFPAFHESLINYGGNKNPELITCMHEEHAAAMCNGYFKIEGKAGCEGNSANQIRKPLRSAPCRRLRGFKDRRPLYSFEFDWRPTGPCCRTFPGRWK